MKKGWLKERFESYLYQCVENGIKNEIWKEQIQYSIKAGGKRFRPACCYLCGEALSVEDEPLQLMGSAIELLHTASLIHDDLPEIDNDDYRRGKLSHHKQYDPGTAVIAGDYIFFLAFDLIMNLKHVGLSQYFIQCAKDLAYGEYLDITMEGSYGISQEALLEMYEHKTARLIEFSMTAPSIYKETDMEHTKILKKAGQKLGIAFQILDDLKGIEGSFQDIGKTPGKDIMNNKKTISSLLGKQASKKMVNELKKDCLKELKSIKAIDGCDYGKFIDYLQSVWEKIVIA